MLDMRILRSTNIELINALQDARSKIHSIALIHSKLCGSDTFDTINLRDHVRDIVEYLSALYTASQRGIETQLQCPELRLAITKVVPVTLIINEALSNAYKHAFVGMEQGIVAVDIRYMGGGISMEITDNGIGIPETLDVYNVRTLGLKLIRILCVNQLKGTFEIEKSKGVKIRVIFKKDD